MKIKSWTPYRQSEHYDELLTPTGKPRDAANRAVKFLSSLSPDASLQRRAAAELTMR